MKTRLLTSLLIASLLLLPGSTPKAHSKEPPGSVLVTCFVGGVVIIGGGYCIYLLKNWCDRYLGTTNKPPTYTNSVSCCTNRSHTLMLSSPECSPGPMVLEQGPDWHDAFSFTANYAGSNTARLTVFSNGVFLAEKTVDIVDNYAIAVFSEITLTQTNNLGLYRTRH
jgi:hypothetical protein